MAVPARSHRPGRRGLVVLLVAAATFLAGWAFWYEPASLVNDATSLSLPRWPPGAPELRVALLADLHVGSPWNDLDKLQRIVERTNAARPDLVLLLGDYVIHGVVGGSFVEPEPIAEVLAGLSAPLGVFAVLGNHDWWYDARRVTAALQQHGIAVLEDEAVRLVHGAAAFWLMGLGDLWEGLHDIEAAMAHVTDDAPILAFTHNPDLFPRVPTRVALTFAGHTHGGQVDLPLLGQLIVPATRKYVEGHVVEGGRHLFVSPGLGTSILPVRFRVPPEISLVTIRAASGE